MISNITNKFYLRLKIGGTDLYQVHHSVYIDAVHFSVRENNLIKKLVTYVILGMHA